jgi:hypothetical protein
MSPNTNASFEDALGLTSLGLESTGQQQLQGLMGAIPTGAQLNESSMLVSPAEAQSAQMAANTYAAAPNPTAAGNEALMEAQAGMSAGSVNLPGSGGTTITNPFGGGTAGTNQALMSQAATNGTLSSILAGLVQPTTNPYDPSDPNNQILSSAYGGTDYGSPANSYYDTGTDDSSLGGYAPDLEYYG